MTQSQQKSDAPRQDPNSLHPCRWSEQDLQAKCRWTFSRASGPGGQNRNKVETCASVEFLPTKDIARASEARTQGENRKVALHRLRCKLAVDFRPQGKSEKCPPEQSKQSGTHDVIPNGMDQNAPAVWKQYCRNGRLQISENNWDWPCLLSILLDTLAHQDWDVPAASIILEVSSSQLIKLLKKEPLALIRLNEERATRGRHELR